MIRDEKIKRMLGYKTVTVVGLSRDPTKYGHEVARYLKKEGYRIILIDHFADEILGEKCYKSLLEIPEELQKKIEIVDIFRPSDDVPPIVDRTVKLRRADGDLRAVWMQEGILNERAAGLAMEARLEVVMDSCMMKEHKRLFHCET